MLSVYSSIDCLMKIYKYNGRSYLPTWVLNLDNCNEVLMDRLRKFLSIIKDCNFYEAIVKNS